MQTSLGRRDQLVLENCNIVELKKSALKFKVSLFVLNSAFELQIGKTATSV